MGNDKLLVSHSSSSAPSLELFSKVTAEISGKKGYAFKVQGDDLKVVKHSVFNGGDTKAAMREAKHAFESVLRDLAGKDEGQLAKLKQLVDPKFDGKAYLSAARVKSFLAKYPNEDRIKLAARISGQSGNAVPLTLKERVHIARQKADSWVDSVKFETTTKAVTKALDTLEQLKDSRLGDTYETAKKLGQEFIDAFTAANHAREVVENGATETNVANFEASIKTLEAMPEKIASGIQELQRNLENVQKKASQDLALSHWGLTNSTSAAVLAKAELANKALGVITAAFGPPGTAVKTASSGILALSTKLVQWHNTGVLSLGPITRDTRSEDARLQATPLLLHDRPDKISPDMAKAVVQGGVGLLNHLVGMGLDELGTALQKLGNSPIAAELQPKWTGLMEALGDPGSQPQEIRDKFREVEKAISKQYAEKEMEPVVKKFSEIIAQKASAKLQGERSEKTWRFEDVMGDLDDALQTLPSKQELF